MARYKKLIAPLSSKTQDQQGEENKNILNGSKDLYNKHQKGPSEKQIIQRNKITVLMSILRPIKGVIDKLYPNKRICKSGGFSIALGQKLRYPIQGEYPNYQVDLSQLLISRRELPNSLGPKWEVSDPLELRVSWEINLHAELGSTDDTALLLIYNDSLKHYAFIDHVQRDKLEIRYHYPKQYAGSIIVGWLFTRDHTSKQTSTSYYLGELALPEGP